MKYYFLLLIVCVFFYGCDPIVKEGVPPVETFSLEKLYGEIRKMDTAAGMLGFKADSGIIDFNKNILSEFYPDTVEGLRGDVSAMIETELTPQKRGNFEVRYTKEYFFEDGRPVKLLNNNPSDSFIQTLKYDAAGLLVEDKKVYPNGDGSMALEYQYDAHKKLEKILHFDGLDKLFKTTYFFYHKNGNLDSIFSDNTEGENLSFKYFTSSKSKSYLQLTFGSKGSFLAATFYRLDEHNRASYDEQYRKDDGVSMFYYKYDYTPLGDLKQVATTSKMGAPEYNFKRSYPKRDAAGSWIERFTYVQGDITQVSRRTITYK